MQIKTFSIDDTPLVIRTYPFRIYYSECNSKPPISQPGSLKILLNFYKLLRPVVNMRSKETTLNTGVRTHYHNTSVSRRYNRFSRLRITIIEVLTPV